MRTDGHQRRGRPQNSGHGSLPTRERDVLSACLALLRLRRIFAWRQNSGAMRKPAGKSGSRERFIRFAGAAGVADIIGILPGGRFLAVECKAGEIK